jgi:hypothetical protein
MDSEASWQPNRSIRTAMDATVTVNNQLDLDSFHQEYAIPLLDLMILASGRPDNLTYEAALYRRRTRAVVMRTGVEVKPREWRPPQDFLFYSWERRDLRASIRRWYRLHKRCSPAIEVFAESVNLGSVYSPGRLLSVASALETYHRVMHETVWKKANQKGRRPYLIERISDLQERSGVPEPSTGLTQRNRELFVSSRNYFAHLDGPNYGFSEQEVREQGAESIRRGVALMQANLLRRLGFTGAEAKALLARHYMNWPIPE